MPILIDTTLLAPETLTNILSEFILRNGTDYGMHEIQLDKKIEQLRQQINHKKLVLVYDEDSASCTLLPPDQAPL